MGISRETFGIEIFCIGSKKTSTGKQILVTQDQINKLFGGGNVLVQNNCYIQKPEIQQIIVNSVPSSKATATGTRGSKKKLYLANLI